MEGSRKRLSKGDIFFILGIAVALVLALYYRTTMLKDIGFYEPDVFYHYAVVKAAIADHFVIPQYLNLSGWPAHTPVTEPHGLYWVTLLPYLVLHSIGLNIRAYTIMRLVPLLFAIADVLGAYLLAREISKNRFFGLLVMLSVALSMGDAARTSALIYRGDGFITIFLILALFYMVKVLKEENTRKVLLYSMLSGFLLSVGNFVWNGAPFATATYILAFAFILIYGFTFRNTRLVERGRYIVLSLLVWYIFANIYKLTGSIVSQTFTGIHFIVLLFFIFLGWYLADYISKNVSRYYQIAGNWKRRIGFALGFLLVATLIIYIAMPSFVYEIFIGNGFITNGNRFAVTIEELQPPSPGYMFASFGAFLFTTPMNIVIYLSSFDSSQHYVWLFWLIMLFTLIPYFFMHVEDDASMEKVRAVIKPGANEGMLVVAAYFATTAYLQMSAVRFNSLIAVPLAILSAYTIYWLIAYFKRYNKLYLYAGYVVVLALLIYTMVIDYYYSNNIVQADNINPTFLSALDWVRNNTPANSVFLTLWPDGSPIEGWADRISVTDSVGSQNASKADPFANWLYNSSPDPQFLLSNINGRPDYLLVRYSWLLETQGIFTESGLNYSLASMYGYAVFTGVNEAVNKTAQVFTFTNPSLTERTIITNVNGTQMISSYIITANGISPVSEVAFYNQYNGSFAIIKQTAFNRTNGDLMLIAYSPIPSPKMPINVTGAYIFAPGLASSNMLKFLYFCNNYECLWNNNIARLELVYSNPDTKIFKIIYNSTV